MCVYAVTSMPKDYFDYSVEEEVEIIPESEKEAKERGYIEFNNFKLLHFKGRLRQNTMELDKKDRKLRSHYSWF